MRPDAFGCIRTLPENFLSFGKNPLENDVVRNFGKVSEELEANEPQNQLLRRNLLKIHLS